MWLKIMVNYKYLIETGIPSVTYVVLRYQGKNCNLLTIAFELNKGTFTKDLKGEGGVYDKRMASEKQ